MKTVGKDILGIQAKRFSKFSKYYQTLEDMFLKSSTNRMILIFIDAGEENIY